MLVSSISPRFLNSLLAAAHKGVTGGTVVVRRLARVHAVGNPHAGEQTAREIELLIRISGNCRIECSITSDSSTSSMNNYARLPRIYIYMYIVIRFMIERFQIVSLSLELGLPKTLLSFYSAR